MVHPRIRKTQTFVPKSIVAAAPETWVIDAGQNFHGWCRYSFPDPAPAGSNLTFLHAERLNVDNGTITHAIQPLTKGAYEQSVYIFGHSTGEVASFEPLFVSYSFRYVQLEGPLPSMPRLDSVRCFRVHSDLDVVSNFSFVHGKGAPNPTQQELEQALLANYEATIFSAQSNWMSFPTDCPHRERRGWLGDAQAAAPTLFTRFDMAAANGKWLDDVRDAAEHMYSNADFPTLAPNYNQPCTPGYKPREGRTAIAWSSAFVLIWDWTWRWSGDLRLAARHYERAKAYVDFLGTQRDATTHVLNVDWQGGGGLLGDWCAALGVNGTGDPDAPVGDYPWSAYRNRHVSGVFNTFYYIRSHEAVLRAHAGLGRPASEVAAVEARLAEARSGFNFVFFDAQRGIYADPAVAADRDKYGDESLQTSLSLALELRVAELPVPSRQNATARLGEALRRDVLETQGGRMTTGLIGTSYLLPALSSLPGGVEMAMDLIVQKAAPSWGYMLSEGPGTLWEEPIGNRSWVRERGSLNHIMLGGHASWFLEHLGGIRQPASSFGWSRLLVAPAFTHKLSGFRAALRTVRGPVRSAWAWVAGDHLQVNVTVPVGSVANVSLAAASLVEEGGVAVWRDGHFLAGVVPGVLTGSLVGENIVLECGSGVFSFMVSSMEWQAVV